MRTPLRYLIPVLAAAGAACGHRLPRPPRQPIQDSTLPQCTSVGGDQDVGTATTECATPGNVQINATAPDVPAYAYPWDDEFYGPALIMGGGAWGNPTAWAVAAATARPHQHFSLAHQEAKP